jgi:pimeloyl-ACP methyl ester carboxylesterase
MPLTQSRLQIGDVDLELHRGGDGPPLYFIHGGGFNAKAPFLERLAARFNVTVAVHPGFGTSSLPFWMDSVDDFVHVHLSVLDELDLNGVTMVGVSLGGWIAADLATKNTSRIARIVLVSPVGIKVGPRDRLDIPDVFFTPQDELDPLLYANPAKFKFTAEGKSDDELRIIARNRETMALVAWEPYMHNPKLKHRLFRINRPTLMLRGSHDRLVGAEYCEAYAKLIPGCTLETMPDAGHSPQTETPDAFVARIARFAEV